MVEKSATFSQPRVTPVTIHIGGDHVLDYNPTTAVLSLNQQKYPYTRIESILAESNYDPEHGMEVELPVEGVHAGHTEVFPTVHSIKYLSHGFWDLGTLLKNLRGGPFSQYFQTQG